MVRGSSSPLFICSCLLHSIEGSDSEQSGGDADGDLFSRLKKENFVLGEGEAVEVYTDGACVNNGKAARKS